MKRKAGLEDEVVSLALQTVIRLVIMKAIVWLWKRLWAGVQWLRRKFRKAKQ